MNLSYPDVTSSVELVPPKEAEPRSIDMAPSLSRSLELASREVQLLVKCARSRLSDRQRAEIKQLADAEIDWPVLLEASRYHRVTALVQNALQVSGVAIPEPFAGALKNYVLRSHAWSMFLTQEMVVLLKEYAAAGIRVLPFKGPVISWSAYRSPSLRPFTDIDLLIKKEDLPRFSDILKHRGYAASSHYRERTAIDKNAQLWLTRQLQFVKGYAVYNLDVHLDIVSPLYTYGISFDALWQRSKPLLLQGFEARRFSDEDMLVILCYQGIKDRWERLKYACDVAELISGAPDMDWDLVEKLAVQSRSQRLIEIGLQLAYELLETPLPPHWIQRFKGDPQAHYLTSYATEKILNQYAFQIPSLPDRLWFHLRAQKSLGAKLRYCTYSLLRNAYEALAPRPPEG